MQFDYIIVGAGSAGCVMANRLSANPAHRVLLLEAGGRDINPFIHMPAGLWRLRNNNRINWGYYTEPEPHLNNRRMYWPRGKVLGGSSSINAMCYCRGHRIDYDEWAANGATGWNYDEVLPWFISSEDQQRGPSAFHGRGGPLSVQDLRHKNPLGESFLQAAEQAGYPRTDDFNGPRQEGVGFYQVTQRHGRRCSSAVAYLHPVKARPNLRILTHAMTTSITMDQGVATGVEVSRKGRSERYTGGEIILCGGAINSPQLLMLSGIGPADHLREQGVKVRHDLPGVGSNLQDHLDICTLATTREPVTYDSLNHVLTGLRYLLARQGPGTSNIAEAGGFVSSRHARDERPDIQLHFLPALMDEHGKNQLQGSGVTLHACTLRPESRGTIRLKSTDPMAAPAISAGYMGTEYDTRMMLECARIGVELFRQEAFAKLLDRFIYPEPGVSGERAMLDFIRRKAETVYHPIGTCKMGKDDMAVVDPELKLHGISGLRVVDASVMPSLVSGNTNAPTIMIAEKCAAAMLNG